MAIHNTAQTAAFNVFTHILGHLDELMRGHSADVIDHVNAALKGAGCAEHFPHLPPNKQILITDGTMRGMYHHMTVLPRRTCLFQEEFGASIKDYLKGRCVAINSGPHIVQAVQYCLHRLQRFSRLAPGIKLASPPCCPQQLVRHVHRYNGSDGKGEAAVLVRGFGDGSHERVMAKRTSIHGHKHAL